ncbi:altronate dehydratase family protein [Armatimonas sp.]|uniref:UxaA family hydrolase n=1 Tax=Armatimonas sp. TaxID=1872638 RepID=UPI00286C2A83|nr:altronate dehydratase family protein [Armatimonas sp.]
MEARALKIHPDDDVAVLLSPAIAAGTHIRIGTTDYYTDQAIPSGHKIALRPLAAGTVVKKYGQPFARTTQAVTAGHWLHTHNAKTMLGANEAYEYVPYAPPAPTNGEARGSFNGFLRVDGKVGIRNELWVLCTVGCINKMAETVAREAHAKLAGRNGIDGVYAFTHPYGCAQLGGDLQQTRRLIAALAAHPNCAGVLLMGLGCENNALMDQVAAFRVADQNRVRYFSAQEVSDEIGEGVRLLSELAEIAADDVRTPQPLSKLVLGMKCGGSDGFSGLTANPLVGVLSDRLAAAGGVSVLTEVPEMFGAEKLLMQRAADEPTFHAIERMINDFKDYFRKYNEPISENPAPGNKAGGITTLEEKSLGCIQKGGATAPIAHILGYGEPLAPNPTPGIALAYGPGSDVVSCTTLAGTGAQLVLFTTGRGTPFGTCAPTFKIATNSGLATRKPGWIDFDAGRLVEEGIPLETLADELMALVIQAASGEYFTKAERNGCREIALFKDGVIN